MTKRDWHFYLISYHLQHLCGGSSTPSNSSNQNLISFFFLTPVLLLVSLTLSCEPESKTIQVLVTVYQVFLYSNLCLRYLLVKGIESFKWTEKCLILKNSLQSNVICLTFSFNNNTSVFFFFFFSIFLVNRFGNCS